MAAKASKLEIAFAEMSVSIKGIASDVAEIKARLDIMDENFARKEEVAKQGIVITELRNFIQAQEINVAVLRSQFKTWGIAGGVVITLLSAFISALQGIHL